MKMRERIPEPVVAFQVNRKMAAIYFNICFNYAFVSSYSLFACVVHQDKLHRVAVVDGGAWSLEVGNNKT